MHYVTYYVHRRGCHIHRVVEDEVYFNACEQVIDALVEYYDENGTFQCTYQQTSDIITDIITDVYGDVEVGIIVAFR